MKIEDFKIGDKIREKDYGGYYILCVGYVIDDGGDNTYLCRRQRESNEWELYKEVKRYWKWNVDEDGWQETYIYLNDEGLDTIGCGYLDWSKLEKYKLEDRYIDV